jgi:hypothetical protein
MVTMKLGRLVLACALAAAVASPALADPAALDMASAHGAKRLVPRLRVARASSPVEEVLLTRSAAAWHGLTMDQRITDHLTDLGNLVGRHLDLLTDDMVALRVDGRANRAWLRVGGGDARYLSLHLATDWHFVGNVAEVYARLQVGVAGHKLDLALPEVELSGDSYRGRDAVVIDVPLLQRRF